MLILKVVIAKLLLNFHFEPQENTSNIPIVPDLVVRPARPVYVKFIPIVK